MLRKIQESDLAALTAYIADYKTEQGPTSTEADKASIAKELARCVGSQEHEVFLSLSDDSTILGFILVHWCPFPLWKGLEAYISDLVVGAKARGLGIGGKLIDFVEAEARRKGCVRLMLNNPKDYESYKREFYKKRGYEERTNFANFIKRLD